MLRRVGTLLPVLWLSVSACSGRGGTEDVPPSDSPVRVEVINRHALPVEVYAVGGGSSQRLGLVNPGLNAHFAISANLTRSGAVELQAGPTASSQRYSSGQLLLAPGTIVELVVNAQLFSSTATVRQ